MIPVIGLHGPIGSGKDTLANLLQDRIDAVKLKFADPLYAMCTAIDPVFNPMMTHQDKQGYVLNNAALGTRRNFIEKAGTEFLRNIINPDFFTLYMDSSITAVRHMVGNAVIVVSDVRFENEAEFIRSIGGHIVHLKPNWECERTGHASDSGLKYNTGDSLLGLSQGKVEVGYKALTAIIADIYGTSLPQIR